MTAVLGLLVLAQVVALAWLATRLHALFRTVRDRNERVAESLSVQAREFAGLKKQSDVLRLDLNAVLDAVASLKAEQATLHRRSSELADVAAAHGRSLQDIRSETVAHGDALALLTRRANDEALRVGRLEIVAAALPKSKAKAKRRTS